MISQTGVFFNRKNECAVQSLRLASRATSLCTREAPTAHFPSCPPLCKGGMKGGIVARRQPPNRACERKHIVLPCCGSISCLRSANISRGVSRHICPRGARYALRHDIASLRYALRHDMPSARDMFPAGTFRRILLPENLGFESLIRLGKPRHLPHIRWKAPAARFPLPPLCKGWTEGGLSRGISRISCLRKKAYRAAAPRQYLVFAFCKHIARRQPPNLPRGARYSFAAICLAARYTFGAICLRRARIP